MKKHMPKLLALVLTLLLTLALLPIPAAQAAAYDDDPNFVVPAPSNLELSFRADGKCTIKFNNNLGEDFILSERFRMVVEIYDADTNEMVHESSHFYNTLYTGPVTEKTFNTSLGAGNYYAKLYNRLTVGIHSLAEKARSETVTSNTATLDPNAKVVYDIEFTRCKLNYQPGESPSINDYAVASGKPYSINGVVWNRYPADENGNPQASDCFWSSEYSLNTNRFTKFEKGYFYRCTVIFTTPTDGYSWAPSGLGASLNGEKLDFSPKVFSGGIHLVQSGYLDLTSSKEITNAAVSGATLTLPASGLPAFTGIVPADADYEIDNEAWTDADGKSYTSSAAKNASLEAQGLLLTELADGKTYTYSVTLKPKDSKRAFPKDMTQITFSFDNVVIPLTTANAALTNGYLTVDHLATYTIPDKTETYLTDFAVEGATLKLQAGETPAGSPASLFTGHAPAGADYTVISEAIYELPAEGGMKLITSNAAENERLRPISRLITEFEPGHTYLYSVAFAAANGKTINQTASALSVQVNGKSCSVDPANVLYDQEQNVVGFRFLIPITIPDENTITDLVVEDATLTLVAGEAPKFTGHAPADADYTLLYEGWEDEYGRYLFNDKAYNAGFPDLQRFTLPEAGKTYYYCLTFLMKDGSTKFFSAKDQASLTVNGKAVSLDNASYNVTLENNLPVLNVDEAISVVAAAPGGTSFIEPDYYPDYAENEDVAPAAAPAPATPGRDESDTAPKTADAPILPTLLLAALSALVLVRAKKRLCR